MSESTRNACTLAERFGDDCGCIVEVEALDAGPWPSDEAHAQHLTPVVLALWNWPDWSAARRVVWARMAALRPFNLTAAKYSHCPLHG